MHWRKISESENENDNDESEMSLSAFKGVCFNCNKKGH